MVKQGKKLPALIASTFFIFKYFSMSFKPINIYTWEIIAVELLYQNIATSGHTYVCFLALCLQMFSKNGPFSKFNIFLSYKYFDLTFLHNKDMHIKLEK